MEYTFPELTPEENADIREARARGWASFYPALPNARAQAEKTLRGARKFLEKRQTEQFHVTEDDLKRALGDPEVGRQLAEDFGAPSLGEEGD